MLCAVDWIRVLVWFKRKQWGKGCSEHGLLPDQVNCFVLQLCVGAIYTGSTTDKSLGNSALLRIAWTFSSGFGAVLQQGTPSYEFA